MRYDARNQEAIKYLHPAAAHKAWQALEELAFVGEDALLSGFRTNEEQAKKYAQGRTEPGIIVTNAKPGWSFHNYGLAFDLVPVGPLGIPLEKRTRLEWAAGARYDTYGRLLQAIGFQWGFQLWGYDKPHFQYTQGLTIEEVRANKRPDATRARAERLAALQDRLDDAMTALQKPWMQRYGMQKRKAHLEEFVVTMQERIKGI